MEKMPSIWLRVRRSALDLLEDCRGIAATEFAVIVPVMLVMFFGMVEFSSGVAVNRKVTLVAKTLSDLTSQAPQSPQVSDANLQNVFTASIAILTPYSPTPTKATLSEIYVDSTKTAKVTWSKAATIASGATQATLTTSSRNPGDTITVPSALLVPQTYLIFSEVSYLYKPTIGYVMAKAGINLSDVAYTRPRQAVCLFYSNLPINNTCPLS
jgi:Flp pilus assembly protein TadG